MGDVHPFAVAVEQFPEFVRGAERLGVRIRSGLRQRRHVVVPVWGPQSVEVILRADCPRQNLPGAGMLAAIKTENQMSQSSPQEPAAAAGPRVRPVPAVTRSIAILRLLGRGGAPMTLKAISQELEMVTSTCLHILRVLVEEGLVKVDTGTKRYSLGVGMLTLARSVIESSPFPTLVQPVLDKLSSAANVTAIGVEVAGGDHMVVLALSRSTAPFRLHVDT
ncbi:hypothetical protein G6F65_017054 [Rhizopus arrhizus]|nr:hypothetical protein G6F65_017054 [Rhizopus arrhizus]